MGVVTEAIKVRIEEQRQQLGKLPRIREELQARLEPNKARIKELQTGMSGLLAAVAIGEKDQTEADAAKAELRTLEEQNGDIELAVQGLVVRERQLEIRTSNRRRDFLLGEGEMLEQHMDRVRSGDTSQTRRLAQYGSGLGVMDIVDAFTAEMADKGITW